jgi:hypothetical protein
MHDRRRRFGQRRCPRTARLPLECLRLILLVAGGAFAAQPPGRRCDGGRRLWHPHHLIRNGVGFALQRIVGGPDLQRRFGLQAPAFFALPRMQRICG